MDYLVNNPALVMNLLREHLQMVGISCLLAIALAVPFALLIKNYPRLGAAIMGGLGVIYTIPSLALIILFVPWLGLSNKPVILAMVLYCQVILVRNLVVGLQEIAPEVHEAAQGMGMNGWQRWWWVEVPLVLPLFLAGVRLGAIVVIAVATIGAKFGAGGLGTLLFEGIAADRYDKIWAGVILIIILALGINTGLLLLERKASLPQSNLF